MVAQADRRSGRRGKGLSRQVIAEAAVSVVEAEGIDGLSMRKVAAGLGVEAMSLYGYVANKHDLMVAMIDLVVAGVAAEADSGEPLADALSFARELRAALIAHPNTARLFAMNMSLQDSFSVQALTAKAMVVLSRLGLDQPAAVYAFGLCLSFVTGAVLLEVAIAQSGGPGPDLYDPAAAFERGILLLLGQGDQPTSR